MRSFAEPLASFLVKRRAELSRHPGLAGLDYIEVEHQLPPRLRLHFVQSDGRPSQTVLPRDLTPDALRITDANGGPSRGLRVRSITGPAPGTPEVLLVELSVDDGLLERAAGEVFSLRLINRPDVDPFFSERHFVLRRHHGAEPADGPAPSQPAPAPPVPAIDYLAKDYASFRQLMLDHLSVLTPTWTQRSPADLGSVLVELLAYAGDYLSYYQDAVATEAYLSTARQRISVRRHARLLGYAMHEGCNARCWVYFEASTNARLDRGTQLMTRVGSLPAVIGSNSRAYAEAMRSGARVFETMHAAELMAEHNELHFYTWGAREWWLPAGATSAVLEGALPYLKAGDVLLFEQLRLPCHLDLGSPELPRRHIVRISQEPRRTVDSLSRQCITEIGWSTEDALPFDLPVALVRSAYNARNVSVARGNIVLADYGRTIPNEDLPPVPMGPYRPGLLHPHVVHAVPFDPLQAQTQSARAALVQDPHAAVPAVHLVQYAVHPGGADEALPWKAQLDLVSSNGLARDFVVEVDNHGRSWLRFGDDVLSRRPPPGTRFRATYRVERGPQGDVDGDSIAHIVATDVGEVPITGVRNPLAAEPAQPPEAIGAARLHAPELAHLAETCVTEDDYAQVARRHPLVVDARARIRWIGSRSVAVVYAQPRAGQSVDLEFVSSLETFMQPFLMVGADVEVRSPNYVPLDIQLVVHIEEDQFRSTVERALEAAFGSGVASDGTPGYFYPDAFTFGQIVYLSPIIGRIMAVDGVLSVDWVDPVARFQRWGRPVQDDAASARIDLGGLEVARVLNVRGAPRLGTIAFELRGGRR